MKNVRGDLSLPFFAFSQNLSMSSEAFDYSCCALSDEKSPEFCSQD